jgi:RNA polymerase sigma factor (sigma-70 family)
VTVEPFEKVVADHGAAVMRVCRALVGRVDADDVWSDTFLAALRAYPTLRPDSNVVGWLVTIAHRKAIDHLRAANRAPRPTDAVAAGLADVAAADGPPGWLDDDLRAALDALPAKQRGAVVYHHLAGLPYADVGDLLGSSEAAARRSAADGIARLRKTAVRAVSPRNPREEQP